MKMFEVIYWALCALADLDAQLSYERYQEWCESEDPAHIKEVEVWDCVRHEDQAVVVVKL